jgi:glycosyltransferase involved in cell wall biosynthesis
MIRMTLPVYVHDPTASDAQSKVRGIGRYLQLLKENFNNEFIFTDNLKAIPHECIFVNPHFDFLKKPLVFGKIARKQIAVIHDLIPLKYPQHFPVGFKAKINTFFNKLMLRFFYDVIITVSNASKHDIMKMLKVPEKKIHVIYQTVPHIFIPHLTIPTTVDSTIVYHHEDKLATDYSPVDVSKYAMTEKIKSLQNFILYVGDATWNKNLVTLARAIKIANVPCVFVGKVFADFMPHMQGTLQPSTNGALQVNTQMQTVTRDINKELSHPWQRELKAFLHEIQNDPRFIFVGYVSDLELLQLYRQAKVNMLISRDEGFGFSNLEAAFMSTPSILSDISVFREIAKDDASFVKVDDPVQIANKIVELYFDKERLSIKAFEHAQDFKPQQFIEGWEKVLEEISK